jgi:hypothetical protein
MGESVFGCKLEGNPTEVSPHIFQVCPQTFEDLPTRAVGRAVCPTIVEYKLSSIHSQEEMTMKRIVPSLGSLTAILGLASFSIGQEIKTAPPDTAKYLVKRQKLDSQLLSDHEKAKAGHVVAMQNELQNILKRVNQLPDSLRNEALIDEIQNMRTLREFKASQYEKRPMDSTATPSQQDSTKLRQGRAQMPPEKAK